MINITESEFVKAIKIANKQGTQNIRVTSVIVIPAPSATERDKVVLINDNGPKSATESWY